MRLLQKKEHGDSFIDIMKTDFKKYINAFVITLGVFIVVFALVYLVNNRKLSHLVELQQKISIDLIANETQFDLLKSAPCSALGSSVLSQELGEFGQKLDYTESRQGARSADVVELKKHYSLLQIKDYLLMQELSAKCGQQVDALLYFYGDNCPECIKQGYILTEFKKEYPEIRIYSFDGDLDFSVINTFAALYSFDKKYPTLIVKDNIYQEFKGLDDLKALFPEAVKKKEIEKLSIQGKNTLLELDEFNQLDSKQIVFDKEKDNQFFYDIYDEDEKIIDSVVLLFDPITKSFQAPKENHK